MSTAVVLGYCVQSTDLLVKDWLLMWLSVSQLETTEGLPDLGVTSYWTDADGNVMFGPNTPQQKMEAVQKRKGEKDCSINVVEQWYNNNNHFYQITVFVARLPPTG